MADLVSHPRCRLNITRIGCNENDLNIYGVNYEFIAAIKRKPIEGSRTTTDFNAQRGLQLDTLILERAIIQCEFLGDMIFHEVSESEDSITQEIDQIMVAHR